MLIVIDLLIHTLSFAGRFIELRSFFVEHLEKVFECSTLSQSFRTYTVPDQISKPERYFGYEVLLQTPDVILLLERWMNFRSVRSSLSDEIPSPQKCKLVLIQSQVENSKVSSGWLVTFW